MSDFLITLLLALVLWPILSWTRILFLLQSNKFYPGLLINLILGLVFGYLSSNVVRDSSWSTWLPIIAIISAYRSRHLYEQKKLIFSTTFFVLTFYSFFIK
jgi:hypothetical protein